MIRPPTFRGGMQTDLDRSLQLPHATSLVVGTIVGASVFVQASEMTRHLPNIPVPARTLAQPLPIAECASARQNCRYHAR